MKKLLYFLLAVTAILTLHCPIVCTQEIADNVPDQISIILDSTIDATSYEKIVNLNASYKNIEIKITDQFSFFIIQIHSFFKPIKLSNTTNFTINTYVRGHSIGLVQDNNNIPSYDFFLKRELHNDDYQILIIVNVYGPEDPIPGGYQTFHSERVPYQIVDYNSDLIEIFAQPAAITPNRFVKLEMYYLYLDSWKFSELNVFSSIRNMSTPDSIRQYGTKVSETLSNSSLRQFYSNYQGVGYVYGIIATYENHSSAYIPVMSYGCNIQNEFASCRSLFGWYLWGVLFISGAVVITIWDINIPKLTTFFVCICGDSTILYILHHFLYIFKKNLQFVIIATTPFLFIIILRVMLEILINYKTKSINALFAGYLLTSIIFYNNLIGDLELMHNGLIYWAIFISTTIFFSMLFKNHYRILYSLIMGAIGLDMLLNGVLFYAILNNFRRAMVRSFGVAIIRPLYNIKNLSAASFGILLSLIGIYIEYVHNCQIRDAERQPLLG